MSAQHQQSWQHLSRRTLLKTGAAVTGMTGIGAVETELAYAQEDDATVAVDETTTASHTSTPATLTAARRCSTGSDMQPRQTGSIARTGRRYSRVAAVLVRAGATPPRRSNRGAALPSASRLSTRRC